MEGRGKDREVAEPPAATHAECPNATRCAGTLRARTAHPCAYLRRWLVIVALARRPDGGGIPAFLLRGSHRCVCACAGGRLTRSTHAVEALHVVACNLIKRAWVRVSPWPVRSSEGLVTSDSGWTTGRTSRALPRVQQAVNHLVSDISAPRPCLPYLRTAPQGGHVSRRRRAQACPSGGQCCQFELAVSAERARARAHTCHKRRAQAACGPPSTLQLAVGCKSSASAHASACAQLPCARVGP